MSNVLEVFKGEGNENITIDLVDANGVAVDVSGWASSASGDTELEIKDKPGGIIKDTLKVSDFVAFNPTNIEVKGDKFYALAGGEYFLKITVRDVGTRAKIFTGYCLVHDV